MQADDIPIEVREITKKYGEQTAVDKISFSVRQGSVFGLLGPNGAGKTTTIRMIMNILIPDSGSISILGRPSTEVASRAIGYLPEERGLYKKMKVLDHIVFLGEIRGIGSKLAKTRAHEWLARLDIESWATKKVEELSKGMQQKIQFIGCVIHDPAILILDEPFSGLDPVNARVLKDLILEFKARGKTLLFSTHIMEQAEKLCDEIALVNRSRIVLQGTIAEVKRKFSGNRIRVHGSGDFEKLRTIDGVSDLVLSNGSAEVELDPRVEKSRFLREAAAVCDLDSVMPIEASLDEIFIKTVSVDNAPVPSPIQPAGAVQ